MNDDWQNFLSDTVRQILGTSSHAYSKLVVDRPPDGPNSQEIRTRIESSTPETLLTAPVKSPEFARALLAGLWLWHDFLVESHEISQGLSGTTGSFWHAIMHRREGDFSNAKYWYARCRGHEVLQKLSGQFDPNDFVDQVEHSHRRGDSDDVKSLVRLQRLEFDALFSHCVRKSLASAHR